MKNTPTWCALVVTAASGLSAATPNGEATGAAAHPRPVLTAAIRPCLPR
jgi:hypothetical protein